jgi:hypothetical protein
MSIWNGIKGPIITDWKEKIYWTLRQLAIAILLFINIIIIIKIVSNEVTWAHSVWRLILIISDVVFTRYIWTATDEDRIAILLTESCVSFFTSILLTLRIKHLM